MGLTRAVLTVALVASMSMVAPVGAEAKSLAKPTGVKVTEKSKTAVKLSWKAVKGAYKYQIKYSTSSKFKSPKYKTTKSTSFNLKSLKSNKTYYVKVRVKNKKGKVVSKYSAKVKVKTPKAAGNTYYKPTGLKLKTATDATLNLTWTKTSKAKGYRVRLSTSSNFAKPTYVYVNSNSAKLTKLAPFTQYYASVRATDGKKKLLSPESATLKPKTAAPKQTAIPTLTSATVHSASTATLTWTKIPGAPKYRVKFDDDPWKASDYAHTTGTSITLYSLLPGTTYSAKVRTMDDKGNFLSDYSEKVTITTPSAPLPLRVGGYNIFCAGCSKMSAEQKPWTTRKPLVVNVIQSQDVDVIGLQEASQAWLYDSSGKKYSKSQFEDLIEALGTPWALTNTHRNNCVKSTTPTGCVYQDQGASGGTRIIYRTDRLELLDSGSKKLPELADDYTDRYLAWAVFRQLSTGKKFFFSNTHLEPEKETSAPWNFYNLRQEQAQTILDTIAERNPDGLPVFLVGDLQGHKNSVPDNGPYNLVTQAGGLIDPLGNLSNTYANPIAGNLINATYNSYNSFKRTLPKSSPLGQNFDYILTTPMEVSEFETVVNVDAAGKWIGTMPSDHNMLRVQVLLPEPTTKAPAANETLVVPEVPTVPEVPEVPPTTAPELPTGLTESTEPTAGPTESTEPETVGDTAPVG